MRLTRVLSASVLAGVVVLSSTGCSMFQKDEPAPSSISASEPKKQHGNPIPENPITSTNSEVAPVKLPSKSLISEEEDAEASDALNAEDEEAGYETEYYDTSEDEVTYEEEATYEDEVTYDEEPEEEIVEDTSDNSDIIDAAEAVKAASIVNDLYAFVLNPASYDQIIKASERFADREEVSDKELVAWAKEYPTIFRHYDISTGDKVRSAYTQLAIMAELGKKAAGVKITVPVDAITVYGDSATVDVSMAVITKDGVEYSLNNEAVSSFNMIKLSNGSWVIDES